MRVAVLDVGSNTARVLVADVSAPRGVAAVEEKRERLGLGAEIARTGTLSRDTVRTVARACRGYAKLARALGAERAQVIVTAPGRQGRAPGLLVSALARGDAAAGARPVRRRGGAPRLRRGGRASACTAGRRRRSGRRRRRLDGNRPRRPSWRRDLGGLDRPRLDQADTAVPSRRPAEQARAPKGARCRSRLDGHALARSARSRPCDGGQRESRGEAGGPGVRRG